MKFRLSLTYFCIFLYSIVGAQRGVDKGCSLFSPQQIDVNKFLIKPNNLSDLPEPKVELILGNESLSKSNTGFFLQLDVNGAQKPICESKLNVCIVLDRSASMAFNNRFEKLKVALKDFIKMMKPDDYLSVVAYDDKPVVVLKSIKIKHIADTSFLFIDNMQPQGGTNILGGLNAGYKELQKNYKVDYVNRLILMSDGISTSGVIDESVIAQKSNEYNIKGFETSTMGLGSDINADFLIKLAENGNGQCHFIGDCEGINDDMGAALTDELENMLCGIRNMSFTLEYPKNFDVSEVYGYNIKKSDKEKHIFSMPIPTHGEKQSILIRFNVLKSSWGTVTVKVKYREYPGTKYKTITESVNVAFNKPKVLSENLFAQKEVQYNFNKIRIATDLQKALRHFEAKRLERSETILNSCMKEINSFEEELKADKSIIILQQMIGNQTEFIQQIKRIID